MNQENTKLVVTVYGKAFCPKCEQAKSLVKNNNYELNYIQIDNDEKMQEFATKTTAVLGSPAMSVPQIWVNDKYVGTFMDLVKYINSMKALEASL